MGFEDDTEIQQAIRFNADAGPDDCIMLIIKQREERDEAKNMDAARAWSEVLQEQVETTRNEDAVNRFELATMEELSASVFSTSVVLNTRPMRCEISRAHIRKHFTVFSSLNKNSEVSWCDLVELAESWKTRELRVSDLESTISE
jgi:hypothetical protein